MTAKEILYAMPGKVNISDIEGVNTIFHFDFASDGQHTIKIADGNVTVEDGLNGEAECVLTASADDFTKLMSGDLNPMMAVMMGKIKLSNMGAMMKYAKLFGIM
jgi:putative sterol carrier protein